LPADLIFAEGQQLTYQNKEALWKIFRAIGDHWDNTLYKSNNQRSSWYEMIKAKSENSPNYTGEYVNAIYVMNELYDLYGKEGAFNKLFFESNIPPNEPPLTRLAHCKVFVVNEFIRMQLIGGAFKSWGEKHTGKREDRGKNYEGYLGGSRYNRSARVRDYKPKT